MIFLVNRLGEVNVITADVLAVLDQASVEVVFKACAWCPSWYAASELARKRRRAIEELRRK